MEKTKWWDKFKKFKSRSRSLQNSIKYLFSLDFPYLIWSRICNHCICVINDGLNLSTFDWFRILWSSYPVSFHFALLLQLWQCVSYHYLINLSPNCSIWAHGQRCVSLHPPKRLKWWHLKGQYMGKHESLPFIDLDHSKKNREKTTN